jgi:hypothetical protein
MSILSPGNTVVFVKSMVLSTALLLASTAAQATIIHDESVDGDITITPPTTFLLASGQQSIIGRSRFFLPKTSDFDDFIFEIPQGFVLNSIEYQETLAASVVDNLSIRFEIRAINQDGHPLAGPTLASRSIDLHVGQQHMLFNTPWQAGKYAFVAAEYQRGINPLAWDYTINFDLSPQVAVNTPSGLWLMISAAFAFSVRRWMNKPS